MFELPLELATEVCEREPVVVKGLEDDGRAALEQRSDPCRIGDAGKAVGSPGQVARVFGPRHLAAVTDESERRISRAAVREPPLDVRHGEEVVETPVLGAGNGERLLLPVGREKLVARDGIDTARERARSS